MNFAVLRSQKTHSDTSQRHEICGRPEEGFVVLSLDQQSQKHAGIEAATSNSLDHVHWVRRHSNSVMRDWQNVLQPGQSWALIGPGSLVRKALSLKDINATIEPHSKVSFLASLLAKPW